MRVCVLLPDYSTTGVDYKNYDPPRDLAPLIPEAEVVTVFLNKLTTYKQLKELSRQGFDIYVNLCEGYLEWEVPSIDVIYTLELLNLPHTGPSTKLYDPPKKLMKYLAYCEGVQSPGFVEVEKPEDIEEAERSLKYPLFVKPGKSGDSLGIDQQSLVRNREELQAKVNAIISEYGPLLVEEYISGREFTVLVAANADGKSCTVFKPVEYVFPGEHRFKTYSLKTSELHPDCNRPCQDPELEAALRLGSEKIFRGFDGVGYARLDFRVSENKEIFFLEINFTCSVFYKDGFEGSADYILYHDGVGQAGFLRHIIEEGMARHQRTIRPFVMKGNAIAGYGIYASRDLNEGEILFQGEEKAQRLVTKRYVEKCWNGDQQLHFRRYAYPVSPELYVLWDEDPSEWAPQNHCCDPNTAFDGLNVRATRPIARGEELTLDYAHFLDENMEPFQCQCGSSNCRGLILGTKGNSFSVRELALNGKLPLPETGGASPAHVDH